MTDWSPSPVYIWTCRCGLQLSASDAVELEMLKQAHFDSHVGVT